MTLPRTIRTTACFPVLFLLMFSSVRNHTEANEANLVGTNCNVAEFAAFIGIVFSSDENDDAWVTEVADDGPAAKAGLKPGDTITKINDERIKTVKRFRELMKDKKAGEEIKLTVRRGKEKLVLSVTLGERTH
jgi:S1-C subfamily serine protease